MEALSLIDVSSEDDVLISPGDRCLLDPPSPIDQSRSTIHSVESTENLHFEETNLKEEPTTEVTDLTNEFPELSLSPIRTVQNKYTGDLHFEEESRTKADKLNNEFPELSLSPEQKRSKKETNLRKSLAWDSAFLTCEGVLNMEELASINTTFQKTSKTALAGIPEESRRSAESSTTVDSDSWTLESLETELFDNVRVSIQKSLGGGFDKDRNVIKSKIVGLGASWFGCEL